MWEQATLPRAAWTDDLDVFFAPAYTSPLWLGVPTVLTIHDLSYMARPEWYRTRERWRRALITRASARRARAILTDSAFSRGEVTRLLGVPPDRVTVIPLGLGMISRAPATSAHREPLVLFVGSIFNRRRVPDLIQAFAALPASTPERRLELVGENRTWPRLDIDGIAAGSEASPRIRVRAWICDAELADLYRRASAFAFLSEYEGFGLTPLEALAHGVPVVVLDTPVAREVCRDAAVYVRPGDIAGTTAALQAVLTDTALRTRLLAAAEALLPRYDWAATARATLDVLTGVAAT
jgi:glycosyltransferase involved in cell wall biosynthesis